MKYQIVLTTALAVSASAVVAIEQTPKELNTNTSKALLSKETGVTTLITLDKLKAFPTAEGAGANTIGGRGGRVIYVENRNASGPGSLKAALEAEGKRTIVFAIGGRFNNDARINVGNRYPNGQPDEAYKHGNFTLAGQTANDKGGVHMANSRTNRCRSGGGEVTFNIFRQEEMILRYFDTRYNWEWWAVPPESPICPPTRPTPEQQHIPSLRIEEAKNLVVDHISSGWSTYGLVIRRLS